MSAAVCLSCATRRTGQDVTTSTLAVAGYLDRLAAALDNGLTAEAAAANLRDRAAALAVLAEAMTATAEGT